MTRHRLALPDFQRKLRSIQHDAVLIQDVPAEKNYGFFLMSKDFNGDSLRVSDRKVHAVGRQQKDLAAKASHRNFVQRDETQLDDHICGDDCPVGGGIQLRRQIGPDLASCGAV